MELDTTKYTNEIFPFFDNYIDKDGWVYSCIKNNEFSCQGCILKEKCRIFNPAIKPERR